MADDKTGQGPSAAMTRVNPEYTDRIYFTALALVSCNFFLAYYNLFPAQFLNLPAEIRTFAWPLNANYEAALLAFHFSPSDVSAVTQTTAITSIVMMAALVVRFVLELAMPRTEFRSEFVILCSGMVVGVIWCFWMLRFTDERGLLELDIHLPMFKNMIELNFFLFLLYYMVSELLCQIVSYCRQLRTP